MSLTSLKQTCNEYLIKFSENQSAPKLENRKTSPSSPCAPNLLHVLVSRILGYHNLCSPEMIQHRSLENMLGSRMHDLEIFWIFSPSEQPTHTSWAWASLFPTTPPPMSTHLASTHCKRTSTQSTQILLSSGITELLVLCSSKLTPC